MSESKREAAHTPGPWFVGAQNDALYILDRRPAHDNDYPDHEADVGCIAKVYDDIRDAEIGRANAALIARAPDLAAEVERLRAENDKLRAKLGNSPEPCAYCGIPADKLLECKHGFPGCPRADDMMLCGHFGAAMDAAGLRADLDAERRKVEVLRDLWPVIEHAMAGLVFTGDKAGEVAAQMAAARAALASTEGGAK